MEDLGQDIVMAVKLAQKAESFLADQLGATGTGLGEMIRTVEPQIRRLSPSFLTNLKQFTVARNKLVHEQRPSLALREDFKLVCQKLELEIDHYAEKLRKSRTPENCGAEDGPTVAPRRAPPPSANGARPAESKGTEPLVIEAEIVEEVGGRDSDSGNGVVPFGTKAPPRFLFVCAQGYGEYQTLRDAISAARDGDKIYVLPGVYRETFQIEKTVEIVGQGESCDEVMIESEEDIAYLQASGVSIRGVSFRSLQNGRFALIAASPQPSLIADCKFHAPDGTGIIIVDRSRLMVERCSFNGCKHGIRVEGSYAAILKSTFAGNANGVLLRGGCESVLEDNDFSRNEASGVEIQAGTAAQITQNRFRAGAAGIVVAETSQGRISGNQFFGHSEQSAVLLMAGASAVAVEGNVHHAAET